MRDLVLRALVVLAVLPRAIAAARTRRAASPAEPVEQAAPPPSAAVRRIRSVLVALGVVLIAVGVGALVAGVPLHEWTGIGVWLVVALILHDGILAPVLIAGARLLRRGSARLPWGALAAVQIAVAVGFAVTLVSVPAIRAQQLGARNPTVLVFDYPVVLAAAWAVVGAGVAAAIVAGAIRRARSVPDPQVAGV